MIKTYDITYRVTYETKTYEMTYRVTYETKTYEWKYRVTYETKTYEITYCELQYIVTQNNKYIKQINQQVN